MKNILAAALVVVALVGCVSTPNGDIPEAVVEYSETRVFRLRPESANGGGTGFSVTPEIMITACHVAKNWPRMIAENARGDMYMVETRVCDEESDVAVLVVVDIDKPDVDPAIFTGTPRVGTQVYGSGNPLGRRLVITSGHWQQRIDPEDTPKRGAYMTSLPTINGDSGSPVLIYDKGRVVVAGIRVAILFAPGAGMGPFTAINPITHLTMVIETEEIIAAIVEGTRIKDE